MESYNIIVSGKVQGVFYRKFCSQALMKLHIQGYIQNLKDGTVEVVARIYDDDYDSVLDVLRSGSPLSRTDDINVTILDSDDISHDGFVVRS